MTDRAIGGLAYWRRTTCLLVGLLQAYSGAGCSAPLIIYVHRQGKAEENFYTIFVIIILKSQPSFPYYYRRLSLGNKTFTSFNFMTTKGINDYKKPGMTESNIRMINTQSIRQQLKKAFPFYIYPTEYGLLCAECMSFKGQRTGFLCNLLNLCTL